MPAITRRIPGDTRFDDWPTPPTPSLSPLCHAGPGRLAHRNSASYLLTPGRSGTMLSRGSSPEGVRSMLSGTPQLTRRDLLAMIGTLAGSAAMYQAMTTLGFAQESPYKGPIKLDGDPKGASVLILGAGLAGMVAAYELQQGRLQGPDPRIPPKGRRPLLDAARRRQLHRARRLRAGMRVRQGPLPQSRSLAHSVSPSRRARLLQAARRHARAFRAGQPQRLSAFGQGVRRQAAALSPHQQRLQRPRRRTARQGRPGRAASTRPSRRRTARSCWRRCRAGARSTRTMPMSTATAAANGAASRSIPAAA